MASRKFSGTRNSYWKIAAVCSGIADYCTTHIHDNSYAAAHDAA